MTKQLKVHGVDISHHQDNSIDWSALQQAGVKWMYHKATEGGTIRDANYARRRVEAKHAGMPFGPYHFARPGGMDALDEARFFVSCAKWAEGDLRPALDLETKQFVQGEDLVRWADVFCDEVERLTGAIPLVYTPYILSKKLEDKALFWVPRYNNSNERPERDWDIWQFSNGVLGVPNTVPGLGHVDLNYSPKVTVDALRHPSKIKPPPSIGRNVEAAIDELEAAKGSGERRKLIDKALNIISKIKPTR